MDSGEGDVTCCWVDGHDPWRIRLARVRRDFLPPLERGGELEDLDLPPDSGLAEQTHVVFFRYNVVGTLFNFYGPRVSQLRHYLADRCDARYRQLSFEPLLRRDVLEQLEKFEEVKVLTLNISPSYLDEVAKASEGLGSAMEQLHRVGEARQIRIQLKPERYSRGFLDRALLDPIKRLASRRDLQEGVHLFKVRGLNGETGRLDTIDILHDQFVVEREVHVEDGFVNRHQAYGAVRSAFEELEDQIMNAVAATTEET